MEINIQRGNKNRSQKKNACNKEKYMKKYSYEISLIYSWESVLKITPGHKVQ